MADGRGARYVNANAPTLAASDVSFGWNAGHRPLTYIAPGDVVVLEVPDCSNGQLRASSTLADFRAMALDALDPLTGPIHVHQAMPGQTVSVEILDIETAHWGWSAVYPGGGLLPEDFPEAWFHTWSLENDEYASFAAGTRVPLSPMLGIAGCTPASRTTLSSIPPHRCGGNMDTTLMRIGTTAYLPVEVEGALLAVGDVHAAQGDGEVAGSGIEVAATVTIRVGLLDRTIPSPQYSVPEGTRRSDADNGCFATTGVADDLLLAAKQATRGMIEWLVNRVGITPEEAYMLCSLAADLRISEIVNDGTYVVSCVLPNDVLGPARER